MSMKPIDIQNAVLQMLLRGTGTRRSIGRLLRGVSMNIGYGDIDRALLMLERDGLAFVWGEDHQPGDVSLPIYALTAAGRIHAKQLPGAIA